MIDYQKFEETFNKIEQQYGTLMENNNRSVLSDYKKKIIVVLITISILLFVVLTINSLAPAPYNVIITFLFIAVMVIIAVIRSKQKTEETLEERNYRKFVSDYKQLVIPEFIKLLNPDVTYSPEKGISKKVYEDGMFGQFEYYRSEDSISGYINDYKFEMANVCTEKAYMDDKGKMRKVIVFQGLYAVMPLAGADDIELYLRNDFKDSYKVLSQLLSEDFDNLYSRMDSSEFEKNFDVYTNNKMFATKIFTHDIMQLMVAYKEQFDLPFEFTIKNNYFYIRIKGHDLFEPYVSVNHPVLDKQELYKDYSTLDFAYSIMYMMYDNIVKSK